jgi:hypothetical protein
MANVLTDNLASPTIPIVGPDERKRRLQPRGICYCRSPGSAVIVPLLPFWASTLFSTEKTLPVTPVLLPVMLDSRTRISYPTQRR